jgi:hypothetical protein
MLATLSTLVFLGAATLAAAVISVSLAKGFAAASMLRRQLAFCDDVRTVTVRHERVRARLAPTARAPRRPVWLAPALVAPARQRVAA